MVKTRWILALAGVSLFAVSAHHVAQADDPIIIGFDMPFSGWFQPIDDGTVKGAQLAIDDINKAGGVLGRQLKEADYDMKSEPPLGADGAIDLVSKGAKLILVPSDFDFGGPGANIAQSKGVPVFSGASDSKFGVAGIGNMAYSVSVASQPQGAMMAEWAYNKKGWKTAYVLIDNTINFTKSLCGNFGDRFKKLAGADNLLGTDTFLNNDPSIATQVTRIQSLPKKPDLIFLCSYVPGGPSAIKQIRAAGLDMPILSGESMDGDYWLGMAPNLSNFYVADYGSFAGDDSDKAINDFYARFKAKFGKPADVSYVLRGYSAVEAFAHAATKAKSVDGSKVAAALDTFKDEPLVIGPTTFTDKLHIQINRPMSILEVQQGKYHFVDKYAVKDVPPMRY
jgi:branched-chain amino acid transport system substrate-binding protein